MPTKKKTPPKKTAPRSVDATFRRAKDVLSRRNVDGTVAIMRLDDDQYFFTIEGVAAEAWSLIDGKVPLSKIKATIKKKYNAPEARLNKDLSKFINGLLKEKLIQA